MTSQVLHDLFSCTVKFSTDMQDVLKPEACVLLGVYFGLCKLSYGLGSRIMEEYCRFSYSTSLKYLK